MSHIGLVCPAYAGHVRPVATLGRELLRRGHRVTFVSTLDAEAKALADGLEFAALGPEEFPLGAMARFTEEQGKLDGLAAISFISKHVTENAEVLLRDLPRLIDEHGIDTLVIDQVVPAANTAAQKLGVPFVTVCIALALHAEPDIPPYTKSWSYRVSPYARRRNAKGYEELLGAIRPVAELINARRAEWGMPPVLGPNGSDLAQIAQQPEFFDFPRTQLPANFHYTGPFHDERSADPVPFPWERLDDRPLIYASMGTLQNRLSHVFNMIADACAGLDAQLVLGLGNPNAEIPAGLPDDVIVVRYAPQPDLISRACLVVTHGGINTVLETLTRGVPMVVLPVANDQPGVAARLKYLGAGEFIPVRKVTTPALRAAVRKVRSNPDYLAKARECQRRIADFDGLRRAADVVEEAFRTLRPVLRGQSLSA